MRWSYTIGRIGDTDIKVHVTFLILLAYLAFGGYQQGGSAGAISAMVILLALFGCVLLHEFGHILMARQFGVRTPDVILLPIGGVARLERIPSEPRQEFLIAIAGPLVTLAIALVLYLILSFDGSPPSLGWRGADETILGFLFRANAWLLGFNMLPAFPMDGGRVLRALLVSRMGMVRGTRLAASLGQALAIVGGLYGLTQGHALLALVAFFVFLGAGAEASAVETRAAGEGLRVAQMMVTQFRTIPVHATLGQAVDLLLSTEQREFPVVDNLGTTLGILTRDNLIKGLSQRGPDSTIAEAMTASAPTVPPTLGFDEALDRLRSSGLPAIPVVDAGGALVGLLTLDNITDLLLVRRAGS